VSRIESLGQLFNVSRVSEGRLRDYSFIAKHLRLGVLHSRTAQVSDRRLRDNSFEQSQSFGTHSPELLTRRKIPTSRSIQLWNNSSKLRSLGPSPPGQVTTSRELQASQRTPEHSSELKDLGTSPPGLFVWL